MRRLVFPNSQRLSSRAYARDLLLAVRTATTFAARTNAKTTLALRPDSAVNPVPQQVIRSAIEDCRFKTVRRLELEIKQGLAGSPKAMFLLGWDEDQVSGPY